jgi:hypothetical protein
MLEFTIFMMSKGPPAKDTPICRQRIQLALR